MMEPDFTNGAKWHERIHEDEFNRAFSRLPCPSQRRTLKEGSLHCHLGIDPGRPTNQKQETETAVLMWRNISSSTSKGMHKQSYAWKKKPIHIQAPSKRLSELQGSFQIHLTAPSVYQPRLRMLPDKAVPDKQRQAMVLPTANSRSWWTCHFHPMHTRQNGGLHLAASPSQLEVCHASDCLGNAKAAPSSDSWSSE